MLNGKNIIFAAGGTGGHIYPALSVLDEIKKNKGNKYLYIGTKNRMENDLIPSMGIPYRGIDIYGLSKTDMIRNIKNVGCIIKSYDECLKIMDEFKPDAVIAFGGYVTLPVCLAAKKRGIKIFLHEQNMLPGKTNIYLSKLADAVFVSFEDDSKKLKCKNIIYHYLLFFINLSIFFLKTSFASSNSILLTSIGLPILVVSFPFLPVYSPLIPNGTIKALHFFAKLTAPNLSGNKSTSSGVPNVLFLVPSGNMPRALRRSNISRALLLAFSSFLLLSTGIQQAILKNQAVYHFLKYSSFAK